MFNLAVILYEIIMNVRYKYLSDFILNYKLANKGY